MHFRVRLLLFEAGLDFALLYTKEGLLSYSAYYHIVFGGARL